MSGSGAKSILIDESKRRAPLFQGDDGFCSDALDDIPWSASQHGRRIVPDKPICISIFSDTRLSGFAIGSQQSLFMESIIEMTRQITHCVGFYAVFSDLHFSAETGPLVRRGGSSRESRALMDGVAPAACPGTCLPADAWTCFTVRSECSGRQYPCRSSDGPRTSPYRRCSGCRSGRRIRSGCPPGSSPCPRS